MLFKKFAFLLFVVCWCLSVAIADTPRPALLELFPEKIGTFRRAGLPNLPDNLKRLGVLNPSDDTGPLGGQVEYVGNRGHRLLVEVVRFRQDPAAYSMLSSVRAATTEERNEIGLGNYGTAGYVNSREVVFFKGLHFVRITTVSKSSTEAHIELAKALSDSLDKGEGDIPALLKHLPNADQSQKTALFLTHFRNLQSLLPSEAVLSAVDTGGDGDAAFVDTGSGKVLLVEYNTPQLAKDNDDRIIAKIKELWQLGQPAPTAYRRVGNYSVFVFNAPDEAIAKQLIDQVKYEQVVQWLGTNPHIYKEAEKRYVETTLGVFIAVVKASGYAFVACLGLGGLIGGLMFAIRRSRRGALEAYSDAGGMLRLNLDELTPQTDPSRLLGPGR